MTLVAAYSLYGIPVLTGDFLITSPDGSAPASPDALCKKITRLNRNLVVGWTGSLIAAKLVLRKMRQSMSSGKAVTKDWLEDCLKSFDTDQVEPLSVRLVGWLIDDEAHCFSWNSEYPKTLFYGDPMIDGLGKDAFIKVCPEANIPSSEQLQEKNLEKAIKNCLSVTCQLVADEMLGSGIFRPLGTGYAYETLYFDGSRFRYLSNILYGALSATFDEKWQSTSIATEPNYYKYLIHLDHAVVIISKYDKGRYTNTRGISSPDQANDDVSNQMEHELTEITKSNVYLESDYYLCFVRMSGPGHADLVGSLSIPRKSVFNMTPLTNLDKCNIQITLDTDSPVGMGFSLESLMFVVKSRFLNDWYRIIRLDTDPLGTRKYLTIGDTGNLTKIE